MCAFVVLTTWLLKCVWGGGACIHFCQQTVLFIFGMLHSVCFTDRPWWSFMTAVLRNTLCVRWASVRSLFLASLQSLKVLGESVGFCKTTKRKDQLYISLLVSVWRIICENFNPNGLILAEIWMKIETKKINRIVVLEKCYSNALTPLS